MCDRGGCSDTEDKSEGLSMLDLNLNACGQRAGFVAGFSLIFRGCHYSPSAEFDHGFFDQIKLFKCRRTA